MVLQRQFITDSAGRPIGVILPLEEYNLVAELLTQRLAVSLLQERLRAMEAAAHDEVFLADSDQTMQDFDRVDREWWEPAS
ncbi:MAG: hypothetical protein H7Z42_22875 [Roseiflexaceae bacterium]|nr:hypothetical protein [Roseiflexaceae bacterium]